MRNSFNEGSRWVWLLVLALAALLALGLTILPEVFKRDYVAPRTPSGLYFLSLLTLALFIGVIVSLAVERLERLMIILFMAFRIGALAWETQLGRHSLWYLAGTVFLHLLVGSLVLIFLSRRPIRKN